MKSEYESYTNKAVGQISDSTLNLIRNSSFQNKDEDFAQWQNISAKANIRQDENGLRWVELTQSGLTTDNPQGITSNYFNVKQGKVTVAVDIKSGDKASLDNESVLFLELYNDAKKRVDFYDVSLSQLGLSKELLGDHKVHRGLYRLGIDRNDAKYMTVKALLTRNGDLYFTNFSARLSSIDDGGYTPNPDDVNQQILKQNTKIEQNAKEVAIKANSVDVTRDIKSAVDGIQVGGVNLIKNSETDIVIESKTTDAWPAWCNRAIYWDLTPGETYTFSVSATNTNSVQEASVRIWNSASNKEVGNANFYFPADGKRHSKTFTVPNDGTSYSVWLYAGHMGKIEGKDFATTYHHPQLELGNKSTSWSPAPEDTSAEIKSAKEAAIQVASEQINIHVNELTTSFDDKLNKRVNEVKTASEKFTSDGIEQTVTKITNVKNDVDRLGDNLRNTGTRNLLHNTSDQYKTLTGDGYLCQSTASDIYTSTANYHGGDWFTYAATVTNNSTKNVTLETWLFDQNKAALDPNSIAPIPLATHSADVYPGEKDKRVSASFQISGATWYIRTYVIFDGGGAPANSQVQVKDERLVEGKLAGSWSPNPDDVNQQITNTNRKIDTQTLDSANIDEMKTQGHYFVRNLTGNPIDGWVYVDVTGNNNDRIRQDVYQDTGSRHMYRRLFGNSWSGWEQGAYISDVNNVKTEVTASVKNLGDRVTTQVNSITTRQNNFENEAKEQHSNDVELVRKSDFEDGSKGSWTVTGVVSATNPAPPAELGQPGMKVLQTNTRDGYEDGIWYSVKPGEKFDVDYWCAPSPAFYTAFGLVFADKDKVNWNWQGINSDQSGQWKHYTGTITAPANAAFAKPWYQMDKPANNTENSSWIAKPHIRRQNPQVAEKISELNTKWDVANGQIQGKVTETQVNDILNGKGYATQSWAQTQFQMKSDAITLQAVRDNITNGIQNQVNSIDNRVTNAQVGERNLAVGTNRGKAGWWVDPGNGSVSTDVALLNGVKGLHINNTKKSTSWWVVCYPFDMGKLKPNTYYTISFDLQTSEDTNGGAIIDLARGDSSGSPFIYGRGGNITTKGGEITHVTRTYKTSGSIENNGQALYINSIALGNSNIVNIANLMIVEGTQSSVWKPAPEDQGSGQNLLRGTADFSWPTGIGFNGDFNTSFERFDDTSIAFHLWGSKGGGIYTRWGGAFPDGQLQVGEQYTFSFDIKGSGKFSTVHNESEPEKPPITLNGVNVPSEWARVSVTGTIQALDQAFIIYFRDNFDVRIKNVKIERGAIATPWTPHPFDDKDKGVNLLKSTAYWNPNDWNHISDGHWYDDNWTDNLGHKAYGRSNAAWDGLGQTVYVTPGVYTWSAQIYLNGLDGNDFVVPYMGDSQYNGTVQVQDIRKPQLREGDQNRWINYSATFYVKNAGNLCVRPALNRDHGTIHVGSQKLEHGMVATPWSLSPYDSDPQNIVSAINITPDNIKIASKKIIIDGNTDIHGDLRTDRVRLVGKQGLIDMTGDQGIQLKNSDGSSILLGNGNMDLMYKSDFRMNIDSSMITIMHRNPNMNQSSPIAIGNIGAMFRGGNGKCRGLGIRYNPGSDNEQFHGADFLDIGYNDPNELGNIINQLELTSKDMQLGKTRKRKGVNFLDDINLQSYQKINVGDNDQEDGKWSNDPLMIHRVNWSNSYQADRYQPTIRLGYGPNSYGHAGVTFLWDQIKPFGDRDISDLGSIWFNGLRFSFGWVHHQRMFNNQDQPAFMRFDDKGGIMSGVAFASGSTWDLGTGAWNITASVMNHGG
ncbi:phage specificity protein [Limosilactobacillus reuteri]|nr:phage specificity protein [Limosilactobacillus reuteri]